MVERDAAGSFHRFGFCAGPRLACVPVAPPLFHGHGAPWPLGAPWHRETPGPDGPYGSLKTSVGIVLGMETMDWQW